MQEGEAKTLPKGLGESGGAAVEMGQLVMYVVCLVAGDMGCAQLSWTLLSCRAALCGTQSPDRILLQ